MQLALRQPDLEFQAEVRRFIDRYWPQRVRGSSNAVYGPHRDRNPEVRTWFDALVANQWSVPNWPADQGGVGWSPVQNLIWDRETARAQTPLMSTVGVDLLGPVLYRFGSPEQQGRFLPPIREARVRWGQGCWESAADLDTTALTATIRGEEGYLVSGETACVAEGLPRGAPQHDQRAADWMFCLVRTRADTSRCEGVSLLLIDRRSHGIQIERVATLGARFSVEQLSLSDVRVPVRQRIGPENEGWACLQASRTPKPIGATGLAACRVELERVGRSAAQSPSDGASVADEAAFQRTYRELEIDLLGLEMLELRIVARNEPSQTSEPASSVLENVLALKSAELDRRIADLMIETLGYYVLPCPDDLLIDNEGSIGHDYALSAVRGWVLAHGPGIYGGSVEDQKDVIARSALGLQA
jgi:alkylation response protein AidB-like acyl-CoA dehydrogenase